MTTPLPIPQGRVVKNDRKMIPQWPFGRRELNTPIHIAFRVDVGVSFKTCKSFVLFCHVSYKFSHFCLFFPFLPWITHIVKYRNYECKPTFSFNIVFVLLFTWQDVTDATDLLPSSCRLSIQTCTEHHYTDLVIYHALDNMRQFLEIFHNQISNREFWFDNIVLKAS